MGTSPGDLHDAAIICHNLKVKGELPFTFHSATLARSAHYGFWLPARQKNLAPCSNESKYRLIHKM